MKKYKSLRECLNNRKNAHKAGRILASKGNKEDEDLVHVSRREKKALTAMGGIGTVNKKTGRKQYFFKGVRNFAKNPGKTIGKTLKNPKRTLADALSTAGVLLGGVGGGAAGMAARSMIRKEGNPLKEALKGAAYGYGANRGSAILGKKLKNIGMDKAGSFLSDYSKNNSGMFGSIGSKLGFGADKGVAAGDAVAAGGKTAAAAASSTGSSSPVIKSLTESAGEVAKETAEKAAKDKGLMGSLKDYLSKPKNLMTVIPTALTAYGALKKEKKEPEKTPEQLGNEYKRAQRAMDMTPQEYRHYLENQRAKNQLADQYMNLGPRYYRKQNNPALGGKLFEYYDNPEFKGKPVNY